MRTVTSSLAAAIHLFSKFVYTLRIPVMVCALLFLIYGVPQIHELIDLQTIQENSIQFTLSWFASLLYLVVFCYAVLAPDSQNFILPKATARILSAWPMWLVLGAVGGAPIIFNAIIWTKPQSSRLTLLMLIVFTLVCAILLRVISPYFGKLEARLGSFNAIRAIGLSLSVVGFTVVTSAIFFLDVEVSREVGSLFLIYAFLALLLLTLVSLEYWLKKLFMPVLSVVLIALLTSSYLSYGNDRVVRRLNSGKDLRVQDIGRHSLEETFARWLSCRADFQEYRGRNAPYPVFVVAAEGGGTYAAIHVSAVLSKLQSRNPLFSEHVFAISSVSGGSLGAAGFSAGIAMTSPRPRPEKCAIDPAPSDERSEQPIADIEVLSLVGAFARADYLSPMVAASLFPDFLQRFNPVAAPALDRSRWFEYSIEQTWKNIAEQRLGAKLSHNAFMSDFFSFWEPKSAHPALVINVLNIELGAPMILAPFGPLPRRLGNNRTVGVGQVQAPAVRTYLEYSDPDQGKSIRLSTAVGMSTRFPYLFAPAIISLGNAKEGTVRRVQFVDGGYYDNTGVNTAALIYSHLTEGAPKIAQQVGYTGNTAVFNIYLITIGSFSSSVEPSKNSIFSDFALPIVSLINTRNARTTNTQAALRVSGIPHIDFMLAPDNAPFPLGLTVSAKTTDRIIRRVGEPEKCSPLYQSKVISPIFDAGLEWPGISEERVTEFNSCNLQAVAEIMR
jgi:hypothetical protein